MKKLHKLLLPALITGLLGTAAFAAPQTDVYIGITSAGAKKQPVIAMPAFVAKKDIVSAAQEVHDTLRADILYGRYFEVSEDGPAFEVSKRYSFRLGQTACGVFNRRGNDL